MNNKQKKVAVFAALQARSQPIQLPELLKILGPEFAERSVRRWLSDLVSNGQVEKIGQKRGTSYRVILEGKQTITSSKKSFEFSPHVHDALESINKPLFQRDPVAYHKSWVDAYDPNHTFYLTTDQRNQLKNAGKPELDETPAGTYARKIYDRLLIELSYNSSRLEGNTYSLGETEKLILEGVDSSGKLDVEKIMILNHKEAIRYLVDNGNKLEINFNTICTLHYLLSDALIQPKESGKIRDHSVKIGGSTYLPLDDRDRLTKQLKYICEIANKIVDPHEQSFFLLTHVAYLQAFTDVNKRTARLSANIPLIRHNLYPISFNKIEKNDYIAAMIAIYELNDPSVLAELYTFSSLYTAKEYAVLVDSMGFNEVRIRFRRELRNIIRDIILKKISEKTMQQYIEKLIDDTIPTEFQKECIRAIEEDLVNMGPERIHSLGITQQDLKAWMKEKK